VLHGPCRQDTKLSTIVLLLRGMRASIVLDVHRPVSMVAIIGDRTLKGMCIRILKSEVLVEHRVGVFEASQVKASLGCQSMMA
jgi:hypothetical protein